jgi:SAM-dependent methyltransferase
VNTPSDVSPTTSCIACSGEARKIGEVPFSYHFLESQFSTPLDSGNLYECLTCGLWFKHPYLSESAVAEYYRAASDTLAWDSNEARPDFRLVKTLLVETFAQGGSVLDFGCYKGEFLNLLPEAFNKYGIEPSALAAEAAAQKGVGILGGDLSGLGQKEFDAVTLFDVFEHLMDPVATLDALFSHVRPGGLLCIVTGIADDPLFRLAGSQYNYVCMPEHICFLTKTFIAFLGKRYQSTYQLSTLSRTRGGFRSSARAVAINAVNLPMLFLKSKETISKWYPFRRLKVINSKGFLPMWTTDDHALLILRKTAPPITGR